MGLKWFTPGQFPDVKRDLGGAAVYLFFAAAALSLPRIAMTARMLRSTVWEEMGKD